MIIARRHGLFHSRTPIITSSLLLILPILALLQLLMLGSRQLDNGIPFDQLGAVYAKAMQSCDQSPRKANKVLIYV